MTDLKSVGHCGRVGSSPILGTIKKYPRFKKASVIWSNRKRHLRWVTLKFRPLNDEMLDGGGHGCKVPAG